MLVERAGVTAQPLLALGSLHKLSKQCSQIQPIIGQSPLGQSFHTSLRQLVNPSHLWSEMPEVNNQVDLVWSCLSSHSQAGERKSDTTCVDRDFVLKGGSRASEALLSCPLPSVSFLWQRDSRLQFKVGNDWKLKPVLQINRLKVLGNFIIHKNSSLVSSVNMDLKKL